MRINLTAGNPNLAELKLKVSARDWVNLELRHLPPADAEFVRMFAPIIFGLELEENQGIMSANYKDGRFNRMRPPSLMQKDGKLVTKLGKDIVEFVDFETLPENVEVTVETVTLDKYEDLSLVFTYEYEEDEYAEWTFPLSVQREQREGLDEKKVAGWVKKGQVEKLAELLYEAKQAGSGAGNSDAPMIKAGELTDGVDYKVVKARTVQASYGTSYILHLLVDGQEVQMWAPYAIKGWLKLGALITDNTTITLVERYINKKGNEAYQIDIDGLEMPESDDAANLDELF